MKDPEFSTKYHQKIILNTMDYIINAIQHIDSVLFNNITLTFSAIMSKIPHKKLYMDVHRSVNHNSQNMGTRQMYISQ
jgi:hypothetical protein